MKKLMDQIRELHESTTGVAPTHVGAAPGTWPVIGEHTDALGTMVVLGTTESGAAVALSPNGQDTVRVRVFNEEGSTADGSAAVAYEESVEWSSLGTPLSHPSTAQRLGLLLWNMMHSQLISKEFAGVDISVLNTVPVGMNLGETYAVDSALARALIVDADPPTLFRFAQACSAALANYTDLPASRARHLVSIRAQEGLHSLDYKDGALTPVPRPAYIPVALPATPNEDLRDALRTRNDFCQRLISAFGVNSLTSLPDFESRVPLWLRTVHNSREFPPLEDCLEWCTFYFNEIRNCTTVLSGFRSRGTTAPMDALNASHGDLETHLGLPHNPIADHAMELGAVAVRGTVAYCSDQETAERIIESLHSIGLEAFAL